MRIPLVMIFRCCHGSVAAVVINFTRDSSLPTAVRKDFLCELQTLPPQAAKSATHTGMGEPPAGSRRPQWLYLLCVCIVKDDSPFDLLDQIGDRDATRAGICTVEDRAAA